MEYQTVTEEVKAIISQYSLHQQRTILNKVLLSVKAEQSKIDSAVVALKELSEAEQKQVDYLRTKRRAIAFELMDHPPSKKRQNKSYRDISNEFDFVAKQLFILTENPIYRPQASSSTKYKTRRKKVILETKRQEAPERAS